MKKTNIEVEGGEILIQSKADALRLAGLHGKDDVRAKVFKKYPSLKK